MKKIVFVIPLMAISLLASCGGGNTPPEPKKPSYYYLTKGSCSARDKIVQNEIDYSNDFKKILASHYEAAIGYSYNKTLTLNDNYQLIVEEFNMPDDHYSYKRENEYNDSGVLVSSFSCNKDKGSEYFFKEYSYDELGRISTIDIYQTDETKSQKDKMYTKTFTYKDDEKENVITERARSERLIKTTTINDDHTINVVLEQYDVDELERTEQYKYDEKKRIVEKKMIELSSSNTNTETYEYNENGDVRIYHRIDYEKNDDKTEYFFDKKGFLSSCANSINGEPTYDTTYETDENGLVKLGKSTIGEYERNYIYDYTTTDKEITYLKDYQAAGKGNYHFALDGYNNNLFMEAKEISVHEDPEFDLDVNIL